MDNAATRHLTSSRLTWMVAALVTAMISASAVHAADATTLPALQHSPDERTLVSNLAVLEARNLSGTTTVRAVR